MLFSASRGRPHILDRGSFLPLPHPLASVAVSPTTLPISCLFLFRTLMVTLGLLRLIEDTIPTAMSLITPAKSFDILGHGYLGRGVGPNTLLTRGHWLHIGGEIGEGFQDFRVGTGKPFGFFLEE